MFYETFYTTFHLEEYRHVSLKISTVKFLPEDILWKLNMERGDYFLHCAG